MEMVFLYVDIESVDCFRIVFSRKIYGFLLFEKRVRVKSEIYYNEGF